MRKRNYRDRLLTLSKVIGKFDFQPFFRHYYSFFIDFFFFFFFFLKCGLLWWGSLGSGAPPLRAADEGDSSFRVP